MSLTDKPSADASAPGERRGLEVHGCPSYLYSHSLERSIFPATRFVIQRGIWGLRCLTPAHLCEWA